MQSFKLTPKQIQANELLAGDAIDKLCTGCGEMLPRICFHNSVRDGIKSKCKKCMKAINASRYKEKKDHILERNAKWLANNREKRAKAAALWQKNNPDKVIKASKKWRDENRDIARKQVSAYAKSHKAESNDRCAKRRALCKSSKPLWANDIAIKQIYKECFMVSIETGIQHHVDHIVPLQSKLVCGLHVEANLQILPAIHNSSKGNRYWPDMP